MPSIRAAKEIVAGKTRADAEEIGRRPAQGRLPDVQGKNVPAPLRLATAI
jgi:hypothetical protein